MKRQAILVPLLTIVPLCMQGKEQIKNILFIVIDDLRPILGCALNNWRYILWFKNATNRITDRELYQMHGNDIEKENGRGKPEFADIEKELQQQIGDYKHTHNLQKNL